MLRKIYFKCESEISLACFFSLWIGVPYNFLTILTRIKASLASSNWVEIFNLLHASLINFFLVLAVSVVASFYRPVFCVYALILLLCSTISLYVQSKFGIILNNNCWTYQHLIIYILWVEKHY
jgi:glucan phosphoethanolaminetransferase (alkaline phosphatase superfamily)